MALTAMMLKDCGGEEAESRKAQSTLSDHLLDCFFELGGLESDTASGRPPVGSN
jgi:hypothetical protein